MSNLLNLSTVEYNKLLVGDKANLINQLYHIERLSWDAIAQRLNTYPNKLIRDAKKLGIKSRSKDEAQKVALETGSARHPTKGTKRPEALKIQISEKVSASYANLSDEEKATKAMKAKEQWNNMSDAEREAFKRASALAIRKASQHGSKLEKYLYMSLLENGYQVEFHKERVLANQALHLDLYLPKMGIAIEVDGLSHFEPIWGEDTLAKNQKADAAKAGLLLQAGVILLRVECRQKTISAKYKRDILTKLLGKLKEIEFHIDMNRYITI